MKKQQSRTDKFVLNVMMSAILQIVTVVTGFISPRLMLRYFGSEINGLTSSITQYISYITLIEAGLGNATVYALYKPLATGDTVQRDAVVSAARIAYRNTGFIFIGLAVVLAIFYPYMVGVNVLSHTQTSVLVLILCLNGVLNFFVMAKYRAILTADQSNYYISIVSAIQLVLHTAVIIITVHVFSGNPENVIYVRGLAVLTIFFSAFILSIIVKKKYKGINFYAQPDKSAMSKRNDAMFMQIIGVIQSGAPAIIITSTLGLATVSVYSVYNMVVGSMSTCIDVFTSGLAASFGNIKVLGDDELLKKTNEQFRVSIFFIMSVLYSTMMVMLLSFVKLYTGDVTDVEYVIPAFSILITLYGVLRAVKGPYGMLVHSMGKYREINPWLVIEATIVVGGGILFSKMYGLVGVAMALVVAEVFMLIVMLRFTPKHLISVNITQEFFRIFRVFISVFICFFVNKWIGYDPKSYITWIMYALITVLFSVVITIGINVPFEKHIYKDIVIRIKKYVKAKRR